MPIRRKYIALLRHMPILEEMEFPSGEQTVPFANVYLDQDVYETRSHEKETADQDQTQANSSATSSDFAHNTRSMMAEAVRVVDLREKLDRDHLVKVEAPAWTGKTALTREVARRCRDGEWPWLPIYLPFRELSQTGLPLLKYMRQHYGHWFFRSTGQSDDDETAATLGSWLYDQWITGQCLLIVDGADEEFEQSRRRHTLSELVRSQKRPDMPRVLLTSRPLQESTPDFVGLRIEGLTLQQLDPFITAWGTALGRPDVPSRFLERLQADPRLRLLSRRPGQLLQMMGATLDGQTLIEEEDLMAWVAEPRFRITHGESTTTHERAKTEGPGTWEEKHRVVETVAFHLLFALKGRRLRRAEIRELIGTALGNDEGRSLQRDAIYLLEDLTRRSGFLRRIGNSVWNESYEFDERRWLEFFAASYVAHKADGITGNHENEPDPELDRWLHEGGPYPTLKLSIKTSGTPLRWYLWHRGYHDALILIAARLTDATRLLTWLQTEPDIAHWMLALRVRMTCRAKFVASVEIDQICSEVRAAGRASALLCDFLDAARDEAIAARSVFSLIDTARTYPKLFTGRVNEDSTLVERMVELLTHGNPGESLDLSEDVRIQAADFLSLLSWPKSEHAVEPLLSILRNCNEAPNLRFAAAQALHAFGAVDQDELQRDATTAYRSIRSQWLVSGVDIFQKRRNLDDEDDPRELEMVERWLDRREDGETLSWALDALRTQPEGWVREEAAAALGAIGTLQATIILTDTVRRDVDSDVRRAAAVSLGYIGSEQATTALLDSFRTENDKNVRERIAWAWNRSARDIDQTVARLAMESRFDLHTERTRLLEELLMVVDCWFD